jgi:hypothetical protein
MSVGGALGAYLPVWIFAASPFGVWSIFGSAVGGLAGIWGWYRVGRL